MTRSHIQVFYNAHGIPTIESEGKKYTIKEWNKHTKKHKIEIITITPEEKKAYTLRIKGKHWKYVKKITGVSAKRQKELLEYDMIDEKV